MRGSSDLVKLTTGAFQGSARRDSLQIKLISRGSMPYGNESGGGSEGELCESSVKWNPLTFAIYNGNLRLVEHILNYKGSKGVLGNSSKLLRLPGIMKKQEGSRLFPFIVALRLNHGAMFKFFWEVEGSYTNEEVMEGIFRLMARREQSQWLHHLIGSKTAAAVFYAMSFSYRVEFVDHLLQVKADVLNEVQNLVIEEEANQESEGNRIVDSDDVDGSRSDLPSDDR